MSATFRSTTIAGTIPPERRIAEAVQQLGRLSGTRSIETDLPQDSLQGLLTQLADASEEVIALTEELREQNQRLAEAAVEAVSQETRYRELFDLAPVPYVVTDAEGIIWRANASAEEFLGAARGDLVGSSLLAHVAPAHRPSLVSVIALIRKKASPAVPRLLEMRAGDGSLLPAMLSVSVTHPLEQERAGLRWTMHDMADRLHAEEMQARLAAIVESSQDAVIGATRTGSISSWNRAAAKLLGFSAEEAMGRPLWVFAPPEFVALERGYVARLLEGERIDRYETARLRKDGTRFRAMMTLSPVLSRVGELAGVSATVQDLTATEVANEKLRESERTYRSLVETVNMGICAADNNGRVSFVNPQMADMLGYTVEEMLGEGAAGYFDEPAETGVGPGANDSWPPLETDRPSSRAREMLLRRKDGGRVDVSISMSPLFDRHGQRRGALASVTNITARVRMEEVTRKAMTAPPLAPSSATGVSRCAFRILLVDDDRDSRAAAAKMLELMGHQVRCAADGVAALAAFAEQACDVVILDWKPLSSSGPATATRIRALDVAASCHTPIIALTRVAREAEVGACLSRDVDAYVVKPIHRGALEKALAQAGSARPR